MPGNGVPDPQRIPPRAGDMPFAPRRWRSSVPTRGRVTMPECPKLRPKVGTTRERWQGQRSNPAR
eukprot:14925788-Heterocapsa_arctica.AAC.1